MDIESMLSEQQTSFFVGRADELALLQRYVSEPQWQLLHFHGPGGMGKTTLLKFFKKILGASRSIYIDGHHDFSCPDEFIAQLQQSFRAIGVPIEGMNTLNDYADSHKGIVVFMDTFEKWGAIDIWLRTEWLPKLSPSVRICSAGRYPLADQWMRNGWHTIVHNIELQPLSTEEIQTYAKLKGIENQDTIISLSHFSHGLPLAMSMACEIIVRKGHLDFLDHQKDEIITTLLDELTSDIEKSYMKIYTEAASLVWYFDQELLQTMLGEPISNDSYREFCRLPYVIRQGGRWLLHDSIRQWVFRDLRNRMPTTFQTYQSRALAVLSEREHRFPDKRAVIAFEKLYLHELDFVRDFRFQWDDRLRFGECQAEDLERVEQLYREFLQDQSNYIDGEAHLEALIRPLWQVDPTAFYGLWRDQELIAFCSCTLLTADTFRIFQAHPLTAPITSRYDPKQRQYLLCLMGVAIDLEQDITGSIARALVHIMENNKEADFLNLISIPYWLDYLPLLGFERAQWADVTTPLGVKYLGHQLQLRDEDLSIRLNRMYAKVDIVRSSAPKKSLDDVVKHVQQVLKHFSHLPMYPDLVQKLHISLCDGSTHPEPEWTALDIQKAIEDILQAFSTGSEEEQRSYRIVQHAYIKKMGTHEVVSEYLDIPIKSYYRYLKTAVHLLAYELLKYNQNN